MRAETLAGRVVAVLSRRAPAFRDAPGTGVSRNWAQAVERGLARARAAHREQAVREQRRFVDDEARAASLRRALAARDLRLSPAGEPALHGSANGAADGSTAGAAVGSVDGSASGPNHAAAEATSVATGPSADRHTGFADATSAARPLTVSARGVRVTVIMRQRGTDGSAARRLLPHLTGFLCGLLVVVLLTLPFGIAGLAGLLAWLAAGPLLRLEAAERGAARWIGRLRRPTPQEVHRLQPVWREVRARAGLPPDPYGVWVEDTDRLFGRIPPGRVVGVTRGALSRLTDGELAAVLAREPGRRRPRSPLPWYWYALPGRAVWWLTRVIVQGARRVARPLAYPAAALAALCVVQLALMTRPSLYGLPLLVLGVPPAVEAVVRWTELRADRDAAELGFAPPLARALARAEDDRPATTRRARLTASLSPLPAPAVRLARLRPYLSPPTPHPPGA
ncbi:peptidase [Streptomyces mobaraensis]|uniref:peptidase n=1 Tax=Streptomyces mobaraensis TaxID=35621 RepID=UPI0033D2B97B